MEFRFEKTKIFNKVHIDFDIMTQEERETIDSTCCICGKGIKTYKAFSDASICSKECVRKGERGF